MTKKLLSFFVMALALRASAGGAAGRRLRAHVLFPIAGLAFVFMPTQSYALTSWTQLIPYAPFATAAASGVMCAGGSAVCAGAAPALGVGMVIGYYTFCPAMTAVTSVLGAQSPCVDVPTSATPPALGSPNMPPAMPTAPATAPTVTGGYMAGFGGIYSNYMQSYQDAANNLMLSLPQPGHVLCSASSNSLVIGQLPGGGADCAAGDTANGTMIYNASQPACPTGYITPSGGSCTLYDAYGATGNKRMQATRSGTALTIHLPVGAPFNGACQPGAMCASVQTTTATNDTVKISGTDSGGSVSVTTVQALSTGGSTMTTQTNNDAPAGGGAVAGGSTVTTTTTNASGAVTATSVSTCSNQVTVDPTTGQVQNPTCTGAVSQNSGSGVVITNTDSGQVASQSDIQNAATQIVNAINAKGSGSSSSSVAVSNLPADYARTGEAATAASAVVAAINTNLGGSVPVPNAASAVFDATQLGNLAAEQVTDENAFISFFTWTAPDSVQCAPFTGSVGSGAYAVPYSLDVCPTVATLQAVLGWLFAVFGMWDIYGTLTRGSR